MSEIKSSAHIEGKVLLVLSEAEARALYNMTVYGPSEFVKWFYANLGKSYLQPHEAGLRSLFETVKSEMPKHIKKFDNARKALIE